MDANIACGLDVVALGELLIDFTPNGVSEQGQLLLSAIRAARPRMCWLL